MAGGGKLFIGSCSWETVRNGLAASVTHEMSELRTESLQYIVCSLDLKKRSLKRLKYENI